MVCRIGNRVRGSGSGRHAGDGDCDCDDYLSHSMEGSSEVLVRVKCGRGKGFCLRMECELQCDAEISHAPQTVPSFTQQKCLYSIIEVVFLHYRYENSNDRLTTAQENLTNSASVKPFNRSGF